MDNTRTGYILLIISLLGVAAMVFTTSFMASVISEQDDTYELYGGVLQCGKYYSSTSGSYQEFADFCEDEGYLCETRSWEGSLGTMYDVNCNDLCYQCNNGETSTAAISPDCDSEPGWDYVSDEDSIEYFEAWDPSTVDLSSYCEPSVETTCYQCDGANIEEQVVEGESCPSGWTTDWQGLDCQEEVPMVTCYQCDDSGNVVSDSFEEQCDRGWSRTRPDCVQTVECYQCQEGSVVSSTFNSRCAEGWLETAPESCDQTDMVQCYACQDGNNITQEFPESCPAEWSGEPLNCAGFSRLVGEVFDYENNTATAVFSTLFSAGILVGAGLLLSSGSRNKKSAVKL